jgi:hypothetical protein
VKYKLLIPYCSVSLLVMCGRIWKYGQRSNYRDIILLI